MDTKKDTLEKLFVFFGTVDDQSWCDIGYEMSEEITQSYQNEDWLEFLGTIENLNSAMHLGVLQIFPLMPKVFHLQALESLLVIADGDAWFETFQEFSRWLVESPKQANDVLARVNVLEKFEQHFIKWVKLPEEDDEDFYEYYTRYSQLLHPCFRECYEALRENGLSLKS